MPCYRFDGFVLSTRRRLLLRHGREQPLIPRYFDLLVFLVERRADAVHRRDIFEAVWTDAIVSDSALSQAIRTIRRVLNDDPREPKFLRTVSRHGYQFVYADVVESDDEGEHAAPEAPASTAGTDTSPADAFAPLLQRLAIPASSPLDDEEQRDAAERLHALGTAEALNRVGSGAGSAFARALLRDSRWDTPEAGPVPILGTPGAASVAWHLVRLRMRRAFGLATARWAGASAGGAVAGALGGTAGGLLLAAAPGSTAPLAVVPVLAAIGTGCGALAGAGLGAGLSVAETVARSRRTLALALGGAAGGGLVGGLIELLASWTLEVLVGITPYIGGTIEGAAIGGAAGLGYGLATPRANGGLAAPRGRDRLRTAGTTAVACACAALVLSALGRPLVGGTIHAVAQASAGAQVVLTPLGRLIGEPDFGPITAALIAMGEGATFGVGVALGLTRRF